MKTSNAQFGPTGLLVVTILLQSFSVLSIKYSTLETGAQAIVFLVAAVGFIGLRAILWQHLLKLTDLSQVYPFSGLVQILILIYAVFLFGEVITVFNIIGLVLMVSGSYFMSR